MAVLPPDILRRTEVAPEQGKYSTSMSITPQDPLAAEELYAYVPSLRRSLETHPGGSLRASVRQ